MTFAAKLARAVGEPPIKEWAVRQSCKSKRRFRDREQAVGIGRLGGYKIHTYECPNCGGWHLTKKLQTNGRVSLLKALTIE
jgi:hypothetical protein